MNFSITALCCTIIKMWCNRKMRWNEIQNDCWHVFFFLLNNSNGWFYLLEQSFQWLHFLRVLCIGLHGRNAVINNKGACRSVTNTWVSRRRLCRIFWIVQSAAKIFLLLSEEIFLIKYFSKKLQICLVCTFWCDPLCRDQLVSFVVSIERPLNCLGLFRDRFEIWLDRKYSVAQMQHMPVLHRQDFCHRLQLFGR